MRKTLVLLAILAPAVFAADVASAAKSLAQCGSEFAACQVRCSGQKVFTDACFNRCETNRKTCAKNASGGKPGKIQVGGNAVVTTPKSSRGSIPIQTGATAVITTGPVRQGAGSSTGGKGGKR